MISRHLRVANDGKEVTLHFTYSDPYEACVFYEHVVECLKSGLGFDIRITDAVEKRHADTA